MAKHYLLLGAGFSRNWGGWLASEVFEYLLGAPQVEARPALRPLLWRFKNNGGFEAALAQLQRGGSAMQPELQAFQTAITEMFDVMNAVFFGQMQFEFSDHIGSLVRELLIRFDAIFTLNQDLLLERRYMDGNVALTEPRKWNGAALPGLRRLFPQVGATRGGKCKRSPLLRRKANNRSISCTAHRNGSTREARACS